MTKIKSIVQAVVFSMRHGANKAAAAVLLPVLIVFAVVFTAGWMPQVRETGSIKEEIKMIKNGIKEKQDQKAAEAAYMETKLLADNAERKLKAAAGPGETVSQLNRLALKNGMSITIENTSVKESGHPSYSLLISDITLTGGYTGLRRFLTGLDNMNFMVQAEKIKIEPDRASGHIKSVLRLWIVLPADEKKAVR